MHETTARMRHGPFAKSIVREQIGGGVQRAVVTEPGAKNGSDIWGNESKKKGRTLSNYFNTFPNRCAVITRGRNCAKGAFSFARFRCRDELETEIRAEDQNARTVALMHEIECKAMFRRRKGVIWGTDGE